MQDTMIKSVRITETEHPFLKGNVITLGRPINIIVGDQGSGKSTLLHMLKNGGAVSIKGHAPKRVAMLDGERNNPRVDRAAFRDPLETLVGTTIRSHGEVSLPMFMQFVSMAEPGDLVLLDEPDAGLSPRSVAALYHAMEAKSKEGVQFVVATHNLHIMKLAGVVFDMETMRSREYGEALLESMCGEEGAKALMERKLAVEEVVAKTKCALGTRCVCSKSGWYNNRCEEYVGRDGRRNGSRRGDWQKPEKTKA